MALSVKKPLAYVILIIVYLLCLSMTTVCLAFGNFLRIIPTFFFFKKREFLTRNDYFDLTFIAVKKRNAFIENEINFKSEMIEIL